MAERRRTNDDLALGYVLGTLDDVDRALAERLAASDRAFAETIRRARADIGKVGRGLSRTARRQRRRARLRRLPWPVIVGTSAAMLALGLGLWLLAREGNEVRVIPTDPIERLTDQIERAEVVAVGRVTDVLNGVIGGTPSAMATIVIEETLKGDPDIVVAAAAPGPSTPGPSWAAVGDRFLLFLTRPVATMPSMALDQYRVVDGVRGAYEVVEGALRPTAGFTLDDVRSRTASTTRGQSTKTTSTEAAHGQ